MSTESGPRGSTKSGTVRTRAFLAALMLLILMSSVIALATVRVQNDRGQHTALQQRSAVVSDLEETRAQFYLATAMIMSAALAEDSTPYFESYRAAINSAEESLDKARAGLVAENDPNILALLDDVDQKQEQLLPAVDMVISLAPASDDASGIAIARAAQQELWPQAAALIGDFAGLASAEQDKLAAQALDANHEAKNSLWLVVGLGALGLLTALAVLAMLLSSVLRPLSSLQRSVRAVMVGNVRSRATVSGPYEVASLANDFNQMIDQQERDADEMVHRLEIETAVARTSNLLAAADDIDVGIDTALEILAEAAGANHAFIFMFKDNNTKMDNTYEWCPSGMRSQRHKFQAMECARFPWLMERMTHDEPIIVPDVSAMPDEAAAERETFLAQRVQTVLGVRLGRDPKLIGFIGFDDTRGTRAWREEDVRLLQLASESISSFIERKRTEKALRESEERFRTLSASAPIGIFLSDTQGRAVYSNEHAVALGGGTTEDTMGYSWNEFIHPDDREAVKAEGIACLAARRKFSMEYRILTKAGEERWVHTTIIAIRSPEGIVTGYVGTIEDVTVRKRAEEETANRLKIESAIAQASNLLAGPEDVDAALDLALPILAEAFGVQRAIAFVARGRNRVDGLHGWSAPGTVKIEDIMDFDVATLPWIAETMMRGEALVVPDVSMLPREASAEKNAWEPLGIRSLLAVPLASRGRNIGCLMFSNTQNIRAWREEDIKLLRLVSESVSSFFERQRSGAEKRKAYESIVLLLATAAEARDPYTENHLHRIKNYSEAIALELGLSPEQAQEIGLAALLHDLGKIRVPDSILRKPGPLSEEQWQVMRKHPTWGEELLPPDPWFKTARQIARWHHENWDGSGYPDGLDRDMIPLAATIVAVADGFDAMTSRRPYKAPWPPIRAMREIMKSRGKRYSPEAVDAFQRAVEKGEIDRIAAVRHSKLSELTRAA